MRLSPTLLVLAVACNNATNAQHETAPSPLAPKVDTPPRAEKTALLSLLLSADGTGRLAEARVRPIPFTRFSPKTQAPEGDSSWVLIVTSLHGEAELPLDLGAPDDPGGDVVSKWAEGAVILRAPYFGAPTRYRVAQRGSGRVLATLELEEP